MKQALFIYSGTDRRDLEAQVAAGQWPDNWFYGYFQAKQSPELEVSYLQITKDNFRPNWQLIFKYYTLFKKADAIFITSSIHFPLVLAKRFGLLRKQKWIFLNLDLTNSLSRSRRLLSSVRLADKIISPSQVQNDFLVSKGISQGKLASIPFGVDTKFYKPLAQPAGGTVFAVGRDQGRDYGTLIEAARNFKNKVIIMCRERNLKHLTNKHENVEVVAEQTPGETRAYYENSFVSVVPSLSENKRLGSDCSGQTVILESMAYGIPVVASKREWFNEYFKEGKHLLVVPPENLQALAQAIEQVKSDQGLRENLIREGKKLIEEKFNSDKMGQEIARVIVGVL